MMMDYMFASDLIWVAGRAGGGGGTGFFLLPNILSHAES
jgi:hypothetical protein